jgi:hypothetical protein
VGEVREGNRAEAGVSDDEPARALQQAGAITLEGISVSATHEYEYKGKTVSITVAMTSGSKQIGSFTVPGTEPPVRGTGAPMDSAEAALRSAERKARELIDKLP